MDRDGSEEETNNGLQIEYVTLEDMKELIMLIRGKYSELENNFTILAEKFKEREKEWAEERKELVQRNKELSNRIVKMEEMEERILKIEKAEERRQKKEKENNVIITGVNFQEKAELKEDVEQFCKESLGLEIGVRRAFKISVNRHGESMVLAELKNTEDKASLMKNKKRLRHKPGKIYINNDLTEKEIENRKSGRGKIRQEKEIGTWTSQVKESWSEEVESDSRTAEISYKKSLGNDTQKNLRSTEKEITAGNVLTDEMRSGFQEERLRELQAG